MRLLVVSDIHGNWPALQAIHENADAVLCLGDIVTYGPFPRECLAWVRERGTHVLRGNHDTALVSSIDPKAAGFKAALAAATLAVHRTLLTEEETDWLRRLPAEVTIRLDDYRLFAVHASPKDPLFSYALTPELSDQDVKTELEGVRADMILVGHTHRPMTRGAGSKVLVNPGSVGQSLDGDPEASYAVIEGGVAMVRRVPYDVEKTVDGIRRMGVGEGVAGALITILRTGRASAGATPA